MSGLEAQRVSAAAAAATYVTLSIRSAAAQWGPAVTAVVAVAALAAAAVVWQQGLGVGAAVALAH